MPEKVELQPAYEWTCDNCGRNNFESCIVADWPEEERVEKAKELGLIEEYENDLPQEFDGDFVTYPDSVTCRHCGTEYETKHMAEDQ